MRWGQAHVETGRALQRRKVPSLLRHGIVNLVDVELLWVLCSKSNQAGIWLSKNADVIDGLDALDELLGEGEQSLSLLHESLPSNGDQGGPGSSYNSTRPGPGHGWGNVQSSGPVGDAGELVLPDVLVPVQNDGGSLVGKSVLVGVQTHAGHSLDSKVHAGPIKPGLLCERDDVATEASVHMDRDASFSGELPDALDVVKDSVGVGWGGNYDDGRVCGDSLAHRISGEPVTGLLVAADCNHLQVVVVHGLDVGSVGRISDDDFRQVTALAPGQSCQEVPKESVAVPLQPPVPGGLHGAQNGLGPSAGDRAAGDDLARWVLDHGSGHGDELSVHPGNRGVLIGVDDVGGDEPGVDLSLEVGVLLVLEVHSPGELGLVVSILLVLGVNLLDGRHALLEGERLGGELGELGNGALRVAAVVHLVLQLLVDLLLLAGDDSGDSRNLLQASQDGLHDSVLQGRVGGLGGGTEDPARGDGHRAGLSENDGGRLVLHRRVELGRKLKDFGQHVRLPGLQQLRVVDRQVLDEVFGHDEGGAAGDGRPFHNSREGLHLCRRAARLLRAALLKDN